MPFFFPFFQATRKALLHLQPPPSTISINAGLSGPNITATGGTIKFGKSSQIATFTNGTAANLNMAKGVYFTSGDATNDLSKKNTYIATGNTPAAGVTYTGPDLIKIDPNAIYDVISYEFKITLANTVTGLNIAYQFGSEEYPDYIGSIYNDSFGFFISGPGLTDNVNMAKLPNGKDTNINTINPGIRGTSAEMYPDPTFDPSQAANYINNGHITSTYVSNGITYYNQNPEPQPGPRVVYTELNGISKLINYSIRNLVPGATYTFKIVIADSSDDQRDSGVFIKDISAFADLNAINDAFTVYQGNSVTSSILANDTSNGSVVTSSLVSITSGNLPSGFSIDSNGKITVQASVAPGTYKFDYTICDKSNPIYCKTATVTVTVLPPPVCYKAATTSGTPLESIHGITALGRAGKNSDNWPMVRKGAHTVLEAKTKGFVTNRMTTAQKNSLTPALGMAVFDISLDCLSIYDGGQ